MLRRRTARQRAAGEADPVRSPIEREGFFAPLPPRRAVRCPRLADRLRRRPPRAEIEGGDRYRVERSPARLSASAAAKWSRRSAPWIGGVGLGCWGRRPSSPLTRRNLPAARPRTTPWSLSALSRALQLHWSGSRRTRLRRRLSPCRLYGAKDREVDVLFRDSRNGNRLAVERSTPARGPLGRLTRSCPTQCSTWPRFPFLASSCTAGAASHQSRLHCAVREATRGHGRLPSRGFA